MSHLDHRVLRKEPDAELDGWARVVVDAAMEVHRTLGPGFLESVYEEALSIELTLRRVPFRRQVAVTLTYKDSAIGDGILDLLVGERLVVEIKTVESLAPVHVAQVLSYLRAARCELGLLINFNVRRLVQGLRRVIHSL